MRSYLCVLLYVRCLPEHGYEGLEQASYTNGSDNDGDGSKDCEDADGAAAPVCGNSGTMQ